MSKDTKGNTYLRDLIYSQIMSCSWTPKHTAYYVIMLHSSQFKKLNDNLMFLVTFESDAFSRNLVFKKIKK